MFPVLKSAVVEKSVIWGCGDTVPKESFDSAAVRATVQSPSGRVLTTEVICVLSCVTRTLVAYGVFVPTSLPNRKAERMHFI